MRAIVAFLCLVSTSWAVGEAELIAVLGARARAGLTRHAAMPDAPPKGNSAREVAPQSPTPIEPEPEPIKQAPPIPKEPPPKIADTESIRIPLASLDSLPVIGISYTDETPVSVAAAINHPKVEVTGYTMPPERGRCEPCIRSKASIKFGNSRMNVGWKVGGIPKGIEEIYPTWTWTDAKGTLRFVQGCHSIATLQAAVFSPYNDPPAELPTGVDSVAYGARKSGNMGNIAAQEHVQLGLTWLEMYVGQNKPMTFEWDRSSDTNRFDLLHAKGQWTGPAIFGRSGRIRISVKDGTKLPTDQFAFTYRLEGHDLVVDIEAVTLPGMADRLGPNQEPSSETAMGAAYGFDPMTIWTIFSVMRMIWQACHPTCDLELPGHIQCDAVLVGQQLRIRFTNMPKIRFVWFWTFMLGIQTVTVDTNTLHVDFVGSRFVHWREFSIVPAGTSGAAPDEEREALPLEVYEPPPMAKKPETKPKHQATTVPMRATVPGDWHSHRCNHCGNVWSHSSSQAAHDPSAHQCKKCGHWQYVIWNGRAA